MPGRKLTDDQIEQACALRERGKTTRYLAQKYGVQESTLGYHFSKHGVLPRNWQPAKPPTKMVYYRHGRAIRHFAPEEDALLMEKRGLGMSLSAIGRLFTPPRSHTTVLNRILILERDKARTEESADADMARLDSAVERARRVCDLCGNDLSSAPSALALQPVS